MRKIIQIALLTFIIGAIAYVIVSNKEKTETTEATTGLLDYELIANNGEVVDLAQYDTVVLNFWATYCPPCKREMPAFEEAYDELQQNDVKLFAINVGEPQKIVNNYLQQFKLSFPILYDRDAVVADAFQVVSLPTTVFIKDGKIVNEIKGELTKEQLLTYANSL